MVPLLTESISPSKTIKTIGNDINGFNIISGWYKESISPPKHSKQLEMIKMSK